MILGTAGHIDHGKTALVRALTGVDTDRLPEEKRRGITIELGFAPLRLANGDVLGVVDVPGHEAFVRTMLAGASGIDVALLVIAADEGPMPQTREHLAILELLEVKRAVVALTKSDLVDADWLALVTDEVRELLHDTRFADAEIIPTSVVSGKGLETLKSALGLLVESRELNRRAAPAEDSLNDLFRLPVDRAFSVKGTGTVVTGTVWTGSLAVDEAVKVMPSGAHGRVRGIQTHGASVTRAVPGMRAAVALSGIDADAIGRGATLVTRPDWSGSLVIRADVTTLPDAPTLRPRTKLRFHLGTSDVSGRVVATGTPVAAGEHRAARIVFDEPIMARAGDRFVLRSSSPLTTIGGGVVTDPYASRRSKPFKATGLSDAQRLEQFVVEAGLHGMPVTSLGVRIGVPPPRADAIVESVAAVTRIGDRLVSTAALEQARGRMVDLVRAYHAQHPLETGAPREEMRSRLGVDAPVFEFIVTELVRAKKLEATGAELRLSGRSTELSPQQRKLTDEILSVLSAAGHEPPSVSELQVRFGTQTVALLRHLERNQRVIQVEDSRFYVPDAVRELLRRLEAGMAGRGELAPTDLREMLGFSRKYLIPFLEFCDKKGYTARHGNGRVWRGTKAT
jgi:selenocysteine-specific elongation factor